MPLNITSKPTAHPPLTLLLYDHSAAPAALAKRSFRVLRKPDERAAGTAKNVFVLVPATALPQVAKFISTVNGRNQLKALLVSEDVDASSIPQMFVRAHLKMLRNTVIHSDEMVPQRLLTAWAHNAQDQLIAKATVSADRLFVLSCALAQFEVGFDEMPALKAIPPDERPQFRIDDDGSFIHWPGSDIHLDLDAIRAAKDPKARARAIANRARHDERYGAAIAKLRIASGLRQSEIEGLSERQVRRIEKGAGTSTAALSRLAAAHRMTLNEYLKSVAGHVAASPNAD